MKRVTPKKYLGQHFLADEHIASKIAHVPAAAGYQGNILEIGPGMGVLSKYLLQQKDLNVKACEIDQESVTYLAHHYPSLSVVEGDFLRLPLDYFFSDAFAVVGNFPYNISSQIVFRIIEHHEHIPFACGMFQREMARRIAAPPGNKEYGILSVLTQSFYKVDYLFTVNEGVFNPPPKVKSGVIQLSRLAGDILNFDPNFLKSIVKESFNQRRKILRNSLKKYMNEKLVEIAKEYWGKRPEELSVKDFQQLSELIRINQ